ncbi:Stealth CR1 domain-containing protein [Vibrio jasicida]|uniref:Stealth CR1 domain-containing protein n=1 Tax=Vibrio jasicida TaxID=766224 RepID=UPI0005ED97AE|nr:Stealth CR1 domain-containing protein [Vibrio jasicida]
MSDIKIDFVVPWVDGSDPEWQKEFKKYSPDPASCDARFERYRDWDLMRYWFRGVEKNAPWVNKIYFITWGHIPEWLNVNHPKLVIVKHEDYIPKEYLPTFSSHPIELNMQRIKGLSEHFVYFNDDYFLIDEVKPEDFFVNGLPCDMAVEIPVKIDDDVVFNAVNVNNIRVINKNFNKHKTIKVNPSKWLCVKYKSELLKTILLLLWNRFVGMQFHHLPQPFIKSVLYEVWEKSENELKITSESKFRSINDVNQYIFKFWQICSGSFNPTNVMSNGEYFGVKSDNLDVICEHIIEKKKPIIVLNDTVNSNFDVVKKRLDVAFTHVLGEKSSFEL